MALTKEQLLRQAIEREKAKLTELAHKHDESRDRLVALRAELAATKSTLGDILEKALTTHGWTPCFWPCLFPGREH